MSKAKILVVDDDHLIRQALSFKLEKEGYTVKIANDGESALSMIENEKFDVIISDIMMPYISGFELLKILKDKGSDAPVLMLTSLNTENAVVKAFDLGADDYVTKPFSPNELIIRIKKLLEKK
ncbi:MAG: response regulator transcription factor [Thermaurantimonas sp.]